MPDDHPSLGEVLHRARQASQDGRDRPWPVEDWADRDDRLKALDEAMASAVAARAVADAGLRNDLRDAQLFALQCHLPAVLDALSVAAADQEYGARAKRFRDAMEALTGSEGDDRG